MHRHDADLLHAIRGVPWDPNPSVRAERMLASSIPFGAVVMQAAAVPLVIKRHYTARADLVKYGFTARCPA